MKKQLFSFLCAGLMLTACGQQNKQETTMDFVDNVKVALPCWNTTMRKEVFS